MFFVSFVDKKGVKKFSASLRVLRGQKGVKVFFVSFVDKKGVKKFSAPLRVLRGQKGVKVFSAALRGPPWIKKDILQRTQLLRTKN